MTGILENELMANKPVTLRELVERTEAENRRLRRMIHSLYQGGAVAMEDVKLFQKIGEGVGS